VLFSIATGVTAMKLQVATLHPTALAQGFREGPPNRLGNRGALQDADANDGRLRRRGNRNGGESEESEREEAGVHRGASSQLERPYAIAASAAGTRLTSWAWRRGRTSRAKRSICAMNRSCGRQPRFIANCTWL